MKNRRHLARSIAMTLGCALGAAGLAHGQDAAPATLDLVNRTFTRLDANADGRIALSEARRVGVSARVFNGQDHDADQHLSKDEFTLLYRELLRPTGRKIGADLERAAKGIEEARKKQAELDAKRIQEAREKQAADSARARTEAARKKQADLDAQRTKEARQKQAAGGAGKPAGAGKPVRLPSKPKKAKRKAASDSSTPGAAPKKGARPAGSGGPDASKGAGGASSDGRG